MSYDGGSQTSHLWNPADRHSSISLVLDDNAAVSTHCYITLHLIYTRRCTLCLWKQHNGSDKDSSCQCVILFYRLAQDLPILNTVPFHKHVYVTSVMNHCCCLLWNSRTIQRKVILSSPDESRNSSNSQVLVNLNQCRIPRLWDLLIWHLRL